MKSGIIGLSLEIDEGKSGFGSKNLNSKDINLVKQFYPIPINTNWRLLFSGRISAYTLVHNWDGSIGFMPDNVKIFTKLRDRKYTTGSDLL